MKKKLVSLIIFGILTFSLTACGTKEEPAGTEAGSGSGIADDADADGAGDDTSPQYIQDNGKLILGLDDSFPPMGFRDDNNEIAGFDIDLANAVCEKLGVELVLQPIDWTAKEQELATKNIDCIWNGFSVTPERQANLEMSQTYLLNNISLVVTGDSRVTSMADMAGKKLAIQGGSSAEEALNAEDNKAFRESVGQINPFEKYDMALMDLETGNSDAVLMDTVMANYMITELGKDYKVLSETLLADEYAIGFRKGEAALRDAVNKALSDLKAEGKVAEISEKWFGADITTIE